MLGTLAFVLFLASVVPFGEPADPFWDAAFRLLVIGSGALVLIRIGLLADVAALVSVHVLCDVPFAFDASAPTALVSYLALGSVMGLSVYGFRTAVGERGLRAAGSVGSHP